MKIRKLLSIIEFKRTLPLFIYLFLPQFTIHPHLLRKLFYIAHIFAVSIRILKHNVHSCHTSLGCGNVWQNIYQRWTVRVEVL